MHVNLTSGNWTTLEQPSVRSQTIEGDVILRLGTEQSVKIVKNRSSLSGDGTVLPMHQCSNRGCSKVINTSLKSREERYNDHDTEAFVLFMSLENASV